MLKGTDLKPNKIVNKRFTLGIGSNGQLEGRNITIEKVAIVSVMAGANPEYFPVILALAFLWTAFQHWEHGGIIYNIIA